MPPLHSLCLPPNPSLPKSTPITPSSSSSSSSSSTLFTKPTKIPLQVQTLPLPDQNLPLQFKEKILCLEIMGVDSGKALSHNPSLQTASLHSIHSVISYLQSKGIRQKDLPRIFGMCPTILTSDIKLHLSLVFRFLSHDLHVPETNFRRPINKCPKLLVSSVRDQLKPALLYLQGLGIKDMEALAYHDPVLLVSNVERTLIPKLECLVSFGFSHEEAVEMVVRCPGLFTFSVERNFKPKFGYFVGEMGASVEELKGFPQYFGFSLEKRIVPRHRELVERGLKVPLPLMLKSTDEEFRELLENGGLKVG